MKKVTSFLCAVLVCAAASFLSGCNKTPAQEEPTEPDVELTIGDVTVGYLRATAVPNSKVSSYALILAAQNVWDMQLGMHGTEEDLVATLMENDPSCVYTDGVENQLIVLNGSLDFDYWLVLVIMDEDGELYAIEKNAVRSPSYTEGAPEATMTIDVLEVTPTTVRLVHTPDENTIGYYTLNYTKAEYDAMIEIAQTDPSISEVYPDPEDYVISEERYELDVRGSRVTMDGKTYSPVTFVNRRIAELNRKDHFPFLIGYADGTFGPARNMTRAEVTTMFARLLTEQIEADKTYTNTFNDVPSSYWAANYIGYMQQFGIVTGFSDGSFRPNAPVTRAQFAAIASRFEKLTEGTKSFTDVPSTYWAAKYINFAATRGWVTGYADGTFRPANPITRAEVAAVTCRLLERTADQAYVRSHLSQLRTFRDMSESHWAYWYAIEAANGHDYTKAGSGETWSRVHS